MAEAFGILRAEEAVSCEFGNLKSFYDWTRWQTNSLQASPRNENKGNETSVMLHPETLRLSVECEVLKTSLEGAHCELQELVAIILPHLKAMYMIKIGSSEIELLNIRIEVMKLRRTMELIQALLNRGEKPDLEEIESCVASELLDWQSKVSAQVTALREARAHMQSGRMSDDQSAAFKSLYRALVKSCIPISIPDRKTGSKPSG